jgi:predicted XRE-type DNA-binding protein
MQLGKLILAVSGVWIFTTSPVWAEVGEAAVIAAPSPSQTQLDSTDIPSGQVNQFVEAYLQVVDLIEARSGDLKRAATEAESLQLQQTIQAEAYELIEAAGLTQQTYWQLLGLANSDVEFRDRILAQLEEKDR